MNQVLCFIGGGNMARSLIGGLIARGHRPEHIVVADPVVEQLASLKSHYGVRTARDNATAAQDADVVVLAVKPQSLRGAALALQGVLKSRRSLLISVAAGIRASDIQQWAGGAPVVRCMPNRPALHGYGMTGLFATPSVDADDRRLAEQILNAVGKTVWLEREADMDAVTAISGSGPAYFFLLIECLEETGIALGLDPQVSKALAVETAFGAGAMARESAEPAATLRQQVTSPGGTTEAALNVLEARDVRKIFAAAVAAAAQRSAQLADEYGSENGP